MTDNDASYEVLSVESAVPNDDGTYFKFTLLMKGGPSLSLAIPSQFLFPLAAMSFVAANQAHAISGILANQQILQAEGAEVYFGKDRLDLHFRLSGTTADIPISLTRHAAQALLERLMSSLAQGSVHPSENRQ